jgi:hypothetical protein
MQIMKKQALIVLSLALPLAVIAAEAQPQVKAAARAASAMDSRANVIASRQHNLQTATCQRLANDKHLSGAERRDFVLSCVAAK